MKKKARIYHKTENGYDWIYPETEASQVKGLKDKVIECVNERFSDQHNVLLAEFFVKTEKHAFWTYECIIEYRNDSLLVGLKSELSIAEIVSYATAKHYTGDRLAIVGFLSDLNEIKREGYKSGNHFYSDIEHSHQLNEDEKYVYVDLTPGENRKSYRYQKSRYDYIATELDDVYVQHQGYYNGSAFYNDPEYTSRITGVEYEVYKDIPTGKCYAYTKFAFIECPVEALLMQFGHIQMPGFTHIYRGQGNVSESVRFQSLLDGTEITFRGVSYDDGNPDAWSISIVEGKFQEKNNMTQTITSKVNPSLYPSVEAVKDYVQAQIQEALN